MSKTAPWLITALFGLALAAEAHSQTLSGAALVAALRQGGYVLVMRHASSPRTPPDAAAADADNPKAERQLDEAGRASARAMGAALKTLRIPVGEVLSSPTYRALQTIRLAQLPQPRTFAELGEGADGMQADAEGKRSAWLKSKAAEAPARGTDTVIVTHFPNVVGAFGREIAPVADGEALVFHPDGKGGANLVARIKMEDWLALAAGH